MDKVAVFADVQNIYYTVKQAYQKHFNYQAFWNQISLNRNIVIAYAYAIDKNDSKQQGFQQILRNIGFEIKLKPYIQRSDGSTKGDWDVGITLDVIEYASSVDTVILLSGDGDFDLLLQKIKNKNQVQTEVYGVRNLTAVSLIKSADYFFPIENPLLR
jgi:uncharacterized LabA/DUF88 family protein